MKKKQSYLEIEKKAEANNRRKIAKAWEAIGHSKRYKRAALRNAYTDVLDDLKENVFDELLYYNKV